LAPPLSRISAPEDIDFADLAISPDCLQMVDPTVGGELPYITMAA
jgi:hypothetical protein